MAANPKVAVPAVFDVTLQLKKEGGEWMCSLSTGEDITGLKLTADSVIVILAGALSGYKIVFHVPDGWRFSDPAVVWSLPPQESNETLFGSAPIAPSADGTTCALPLQLAQSQAAFQYAFFFVLREPSGQLVIADPTIVTEPPPTSGS